MTEKTICYLDMWVGERIQEMKLAGIRRFAGMCGWNFCVVPESRSRPPAVRALLSRLHPLGCIVECSASHDDLRPGLFRGVPTVWLDCSRNFCGGKLPMVVHDGEAAARVGGDEPGFYEDIWARPLEDGSIAVGIVNLSYETRTTVVDLRGLGLVGEWKVRDLWRRIDEKPVRDVYTVTLPAHAPHFIRLTAGADGRLAPGVTDVRDAAWNVHFGPDRDTKATVEKGCPTCPKGK